MTNSTLISTKLDIPSKRWGIYKEARNSIQRNNVPEMSLEEINAEIAEAETTSFNENY